MDYLIFSVIINIVLLIIVPLLIYQAMQYKKLYVMISTNNRKMVRMIIGCTSYTDLLNKMYAEGFFKDERQ